MKAAIRSAAACPALILTVACGGALPDADPLASMAREVSADERFPPPLTESWRRSPAVPLTLQPAVGSSYVYLAFGDRLEAWAVDDGATAWGPVVLESTISAPPVTAGEQLVVSTAGDEQVGPRVLWFNETGSLVRQSEVTSRVRRLNADQATVLYVDDTGVGMLAGGAGWHTDIDAAASVRPATADGMALVTTGGGSLIALDVDDGSIRWRNELGDEVSPAYVSDGRAFVGTGGGELIAFRLRDGDVAWRLRIGAAIVGSPTRAEELIWVAGLDARLSAVRADNGTRMYALDLEARNYLDLTSFGRWVVVGAHYGPWTVVRAPTRAERREANPRRPAQPFQATVEMGSTRNAPPISVPAAAGPAGVTVVNGDGTVVFLQPRRGR